METAFTLTAVSVAMVMIVAMVTAHFRLSIQDMWKSLRDTNPEAIGDFEQFIGEMSSEVQTAQNALK